MAEAKALRVRELDFSVDLAREDDDEGRWVATTRIERGGDLTEGHGRTGEEALRRLVEKLRTSA